MGVFNSVDLSDEQKNFISESIIKGTIELMKITIASETSKQRSKRFTKPHSQSKNAITKDTVQYNILTENQKLPARQRDFRLKLGEQERNIERSELSRIFSDGIIRNLLNRIDKKYPFSRGRPDSSLADERRGKPGYYTESQIQEVFYSITKDSKILGRIDDIITSHEVFPKFLKYSFEIYFKQMKENETSFRNSYKPIIAKYKLKDLDKNNLSNESNNQWIFAKELDDNKIIELSEKYTRKYKNKIGRQQLNILYKSGALLYFNSLLDSQQD